MCILKRPRHLGCCGNKNLSAKSYTTSGPMSCLASHGRPEVVKPYRSCDI